MIGLLFTSIQTCAPLLLLILVGFVLKQKGFIHEITINEMSKIVLKLLLPINIFMGIYNGDLSNNLNKNFLIVLLGGEALVILINTIIIFFTSMPNSQKSAILQGSIRPNGTILSVPLSVEIAGESIRSLTSVSCGILTPLINGYVIAEFELFEKGKANKLKTIKRILLAPLLVASYFGFLFKIGNFTLPLVFSKLFTYMSSAVTPVSLIMVGASLNFDFDKSKIYKIAYTVFFKTIVCPIIGLSLGVYWKLNQMQLITVLCLFSSPIATSSFPTAKDYSTDIDLVNAVLVSSYVVAIFTLPMIITIAKAMSLI